MRVQSRFATPSNVEKFGEKGEPREAVILSCLECTLGVNIAASLRPRSVFRAEKHV